MPRIELTRQVDAPADRVWGLITDLGSAPERISGIDSIEHLGGPEFGVGTRWRETRTMLGREATEEMEVTALEPGSSYVTEARSHGSHYVSRMSVEPLATGGSELRMTFDARGTNALSRVLSATVGRLFMRPTRKALQRDLDDIARAAESAEEQPPER